MTATPQIKVYVTMRGSPTAQAAFAILRTFVACWCAHVLHVHTRLQAELDHRPDGVERGLEPPVRHLKAQELTFKYSRQSPRYY